MIIFLIISAMLKLGKGQIRYVLMCFVIFLLIGATYYLSSFGVVFHSDLKNFFIKIAIFHILIAIAYLGIFFLYRNSSPAHLPDNRKFN
jgi:hypothetical protein